MEKSDEEDMVVAAAKILLSLRNRTLQRWPEWAPRPSEEPAAASAAVVVLPPLEVWAKRRRSPPHALAKEKSQAATAWALAAENLRAPLEYGVGAGSGAFSSGEGVPRSPPRAREKTKVKVEMRAARMPDTKLYRATGSGPTTSGVDRGRSQPRPQTRSSDKSQSAKVAARKEAMAAPSPETPLAYAAAAGSGASSSGEDGARSPAKRKASGAGGSGGASSDDEGCSLPSKRTRADAAGGGRAGQATAAAFEETVAAVKVEEPKIQSRSSLNRDENGMFLFDLNEDLNISWED